MSNDITRLLKQWEYRPGQVVARRLKGRDGQEKVQLRVDLGILQMNSTGRPDGKRPLGRESWFGVYQSRLARHRKENEGAEEGFELGPDDCSRLQQESIQYHHRYICFFQLKDYAGVERDCERNLEVFRFVAQYAANEDLAWSLLQFVPQLLMMRTRARGTCAIELKQHDDAIRFIGEGIAELESFYRDNGREELIENSGELGSLRHWLGDVRSRRPLSQAEKLQKALDEAIRVEDYERAAKVRDQLRKLQASRAE